MNFVDSENNKPLPRRHLHSQSRPSVDRNPPKPSQAAQQQALKLTTNQDVVDGEGFQRVESKKKKEYLRPKPDPRSQREVISEIEAAPGEAVAAANETLGIANETIVDHKDITKPPFILSRVTLNNSLILTTAID
jgi:hypothetical protein